MVCPWWWYRWKRTHKFCEHHLSTCFVLYLFTSHWAKQVIWPSPRLRLLEVFDPFCGRTAKFHGKGWGYMMCGRIGANNSIDQNSQNYHFEWYCMQESGHLTAMFLSGGSIGILHEIILPGCCQILTLLAFTYQMPVDIPNFSKYSLGNQ